MRHLAGSDANLGRMPENTQLFSQSRKPYNSWGNGSAMRVSPCGWVVPLQQFIREGFDEVRNIAKRAAQVTHNHLEGIKGAQAVALSIFFMRHGAFHQEINLYKGYLKRDIEAWFGYDLDRTLDEIRPTYCTLAAITGSIAEAAYGVPEDIKDTAMNYLDAPLREACERGTS
jgi:ADP-ribosylglycohydrolase